MQLRNQAVERQAYSVREVSRLFGIDINVTYRAGARGDLPSVRIGRTILLPKAQIDRLLGLTEES